MERIKGILFLLFIGFAICLGIWKQSRLGGLHGHSKEYLDLGRGEAPPGPPVVKGKVVVVDRVNGHVDDLTLSLPDEIRASTHEEVGTVLWVEWLPVQTGVYEGGSKAWRIDCDVSLVDFATHVVLARKHFEGMPPPTHHAGKGDSKGRRPDLDVVGWVGSLARK